MIKIVEGFVWKVLTPEQAKALFVSTALFELHDNGAESLIEDIETLLLRIDQGVTIGLEVGHLTK